FRSSPERGRGCAWQSIRFSCSCTLRCSLVFKIYLGHNRQGQVIACATCVARLEVVAITGEDRAVGHITERAANGIGRGVVNYSKNCTHRKRASANVDKVK